jgi:hypothetical protein
MTRSGWSPAPTICRYCRGGKIASCLKQVAIRILSLKPPRGEWPRQLAIAPTRPRRRYHIKQVKPTLEASRACLVIANARSDMRVKGRKGK